MLWCILYWNDAYKIQAEWSVVCLFNSFLHLWQLINPSSESPRCFIFSRAVLTYSTKFVCKVGTVMEIISIDILVWWQMVQNFLSFNKFCPIENSFSRTFRPISICPIYIHHVQPRFHPLSSDNARYACKCLIITSNKETTELIQKLTWNGMWKRIYGFWNCRGQRSSSLTTEQIVKVQF